MAKQLEADVVIIGAGIIGTTIAQELSRYKVETVVVEKGGGVGSQGQTKGSSGLIYSGLLLLASFVSKSFLAPELPMYETSPLHPYSPYGVTKLAAEQLCFLYTKNFGVPSVSLRLFTVYGPGQRPDMAFHQFFKAIAENKPVAVYGEGKQTRDFTFIDDVIEAHIASLEKAKVGETYNIGGGVRKKLEDIFPILENICQKKIKLKN